MSKVKGLFASAVTLQNLGARNNGTSTSIVFFFSSSYSFYTPF